jgi:phosphosulfolactate phosphohydrolase-like enzyme
LLGQSAGGRNLLKLEYDADIEYCSQIDSIPIVPCLNLDAWSIGLSMG